MPLAAFEVSSLRRKRNRPGLMSPGLVIPIFADSPGSVNISILMA
jgi:hypothetical protein